MLDALASRVVVLWGWRRLLVAFLAGALAVLALPPFDLVPVLFVSFTVLVWLIDGTVAPGRLRAAASAALVGWAFGFGYFLAGLYWVGAAFLVDAEMFGWLMPFAVAALPAGLALFTAAAMAVARLMWSPGPRRIFAFAFALTLAELARGHLLTGFPWNTFGYALAATPVLMQGAALVGVYGLTLAAAFIFASPAALSGTGSRGARFAVPALALILLTGLSGYGFHRLATAEAGTVDDVTLRIVQPAIPQDQKWLPENRGAIFARYLEMSDTAASPEVMGVADVDLLIWPESALPFIFDLEPTALPAIAAMLPEGTRLITGMQRLERNGEGTGGRDYRVYNSIKVIDAEGEIVEVYDKVWLVPFGEFLPFQDRLEALGFQQLTRVAGGFSAGAGPRTLNAGVGPSFQPLICYEIIFPRAVTDPNDRPGFLLNVTNDAWFGNSPGPRQHLRQARLRAVEEGLPVIRAANSGISAVIDAHGRMIRSLDLGIRGVLDATLPAALEPTPFRRWGNPVLAILMVAFAAIAMRRKID